MSVGRSDLRNSLVIIGGFVAILCWWIGIAGYLIVGGQASGGGGLLVFLTIPAVATASTYVLAGHGKSKGAGQLPTDIRREAQGSSPKSRHRASSPPVVSTSLGKPGHGRLPLPRHRAARDFLLVIGVFVATLFWWIGLTGYLAVGGVASGASGLGMFLGVPAVATAGAYFAARRRRGPTSSR